MTLLKEVDELLKGKLNMNPKIIYHLFRDLQSELFKMQHPDNLNYY